MTADLKTATASLIEAARKATPGEWQPTEDGQGWFVGSSDIADICAAPEYSSKGRDNAENNLSFISAAKNFIDAHGQELLALMDRSLPELPEGWEYERSAIAIVERDDRGNLLNFATSDVQQNPRAAALAALEKIGGK